jgi:hypothetical protein
MSRTNREPAACLAASRLFLELAHGLGDLEPESGPLAVAGIGKILRQIRRYGGGSCPVAIDHLPRDGDDVLIHPAYRRFQRSREIIVQQRRSRI